MHNQESVMKNETSKVFILNFMIQTGHLIVPRRPNLVIVNKKNRTCRIVDFAVPVDHRIKLKESEKRGKYFDLARELKKKTMEHEGDGDTNCSWGLQYSHQRIDKVAGGLQNKRMSENHPN